MNIDNNSGTIRKSPKFIKKAILIALAALILVWVANAVIISSRCKKVYRSPQNVDVKPLADLKLKNKIESLQGVIAYDDAIVIDGRHIQANNTTNPDGMKEWVEKNYNLGGCSNITASFMLFYELQSANIFFDNYPIPSDMKDKFQGMILGGTGNDRYRISYVEEAVSDPEGGCKPMGYFNSHVAFQKNNLVIVIGETTNNKNSQSKNSIIRDIAKTLSK